MGCDAAENYMFFEIQLVEVVELKYGQVDKNFKFVHIHYRCKIGLPNTRQHNGIKNSETEMCL